jgi:putative PIN family toxin of toxin-antitoxin system
MTRVVVNTNVFVSAALKASSLPRIAVSWIDRHASLLKSVVTEKEVLLVLQRRHLAAVTTPFFCDDLAKMLEKAELVMIAERIVACRDPNDDKFLELAVNGHADLIVSGDAELLVLNPFQGIAIVSPATFVHGVVRT